MQVIISIIGEYQAMAFFEEAVIAYEHYISQHSGMSLDEFIDTLNCDGKIELENETTGRKVTITRVDEDQQSQ